MMLSGFSLPHLIVLLIIVMLVFGTKKLRNLGGDLGSTIKEFKKAMGANEDQAPAPPPIVTPPTDNIASNNDQEKPS